MKKSWNLIPKIIDGTKVVESRWYKTKRAPWGKIKKGDTLYFKNAGENVSLKSKVTKVIQYSVKNNKQAIQIMKSHVKEDLGASTIPKEVFDYILNKKYAIFIFFENVQKVTPFRIDKKGFGFQSAWITTRNVKVLKTG